VKVQTFEKKQCPLLPSDRTKVQQHLTRLNILSRVTSGKEKFKEETEQISQDISKTIQKELGIIDNVTWIKLPAS
jgi:hypothetical protein